MVVLVICLYLYVLTRPAIFGSLDFSKTGQIGDTIGGITAPLINLIGALLVFYSFKAQTKANKIQLDAIKTEKNNNKHKGEFEKCMLTYEEIKKQLSLVEFTVTRKADGSVVPAAYFTYRGLNAINEYVLRLREKPSIHPFLKTEEYNTFGVFLTFKFIMTSIFDLIKRVQTNVQKQDDRDYLLREIAIFYNGFLKKFAAEIVNDSNQDGDLIKELSEVKLNIEKNIVI